MHFPHSAVKNGNKKKTLRVERCCDDKFGCNFYTLILRTTFTATFWSCFLSWHKKTLPKVPVPSSYSTLSANENSCDTEILIGVPVRNRIVESPVVCNIRQTHICPLRRLLWRRSYGQHCHQHKNWTMSQMLSARVTVQKLLVSLCPFCSHLLSYWSELETHTPRFGVSGRPYCSRTSTAGKGIGKQVFRWFVMGFTGDVMISASLVKRWPNRMVQEITVLSGVFYRTNFRITARLKNFYNIAEGL